MTKRKLTQLNNYIKHLPFLESLPQCSKLYRCFSTKYDEFIYLHLIKNNMDLNATCLLRKYKKSIILQFFENKNNFRELSITHKQKNILINIFKIIKKFKEIRYKLLIKKISKYLKIHNLDINYIAKYMI